MLLVVTLLHTTDRRLDSIGGSHVHSSTHRNMDPMVLNLRLCGDVLIPVPIWLFLTYALRIILVILPSCPSEW